MHMKSKTFNEFLEDLYKVCRQEAPDKIPDSYEKFISNFRHDDYVNYAQYWHNISRINHVSLLRKKWIGGYILGLATVMLISLVAYLNAVR